MKLTEHFTLEEMTITQVRGVDNKPPADALANLVTTAAGMESVRSMLGRPIIVSSGYRSPRVNELVGGAIDSAHMHGYACDFICPAFGTPLDICSVIVASDMKFDQVIQEGSWVHLSFDPRNRRNVLTKSGKGYVAGLPDNKEKQNV